MARIGGGGDLDMMATTASAQCVPRGLQNEGTQLPFLSRHESEGIAGVDVFSQDVTEVPSAKRYNLCLCFFTPGISWGCTAILKRKESACRGSCTRPENVVVSQVTRGDNTFTVEM